MATRVPEPGEARSRMQRVRVGVTGLAAVLLIVAMATAIATGVRRNATNEKAVIPSEMILASNSSEPAEPLAQLGAAPTASEDKSDATKSK